MTQVEAELVAALEKATAALKGGGLGQRERRLLSSAGLRYEEVDLAASNLLLGGAVDLKAASGCGIRFLRHGSNPGARLELSFGGKLVTKFWAPGQVIRGNFDNVQIKRGAGGALVGKAALVIIEDPAVDFDEDLIISALGPVDLLGRTGADGSFLSFASVTEDTFPDASGGSSGLGTVFFDGSGWELLRVWCKGAGGTLTSCKVHFYAAPSIADGIGGAWAHASLDGVFDIEDNTVIAGATYRVFTVPWSGRQMGAVAVSNVLPGGLTGVDFIIQGIR